MVMFRPGYTAPHPVGKTSVRDLKLSTTLKEASGPITLTKLLSLFGEKLASETLVLIWLVPNT